MLLQNHILPQQRETNVGSHMVFPLFFLSTRVQLGYLFSISSSHPFLYRFVFFAGLCCGFKRYVDIMFNLLWNVGASQR